MSSKEIKYIDNSTTAIQLLESEYLEKAARLAMHEDQVKRIKADLDDMRSKLAAFMRESSQKSFNTTADIRVTMRTTGYCNANNIKDFAVWAMENEAIECLILKVSKTGVDNYEENHDKLPPGIERGERKNLVVTIPRHLLNEKQDEIKKRVRAKATVE